MDEEKNPWKSFGLMALVIFGGAGFGFLMAYLLAPESDLAAFVGMFMLPLAFFIGLKSWHGVAMAVMSKRLMGAAVKTVVGGQNFSDAVAEQTADLDMRAPPGTYVFLPIAIIITVPCAVVFAFTAESVGAMAAFGIVAAVGVGYGVLLRWLARSGRLPFPDEA